MNLRLIAHAAALILAALMYGCATAPAVYGPEPVAGNVFHGKVWPPEAYLDACYGDGKP